MSKTFTVLCDPCLRLYGQCFALANQCLFPVEINFNPFLSLDVKTCTFKRAVPEKRLLFRVDIISAFTEDIKII